MMLLGNKEEQPGDSLKHKEVDVVIGRQSQVGRCHAARLCYADVDNGRKAHEGRSVPFHALIHANP